MSDVLTAIQKRSSTRGYAQQKLTKEEVERLVHAGLQAPTAANKQEIHFTVIDGDNPILAEIEAEKNVKMNLQNPPHNFYWEAPIVIILSADREFPWSAVDAGIAVENISLAAEGLGLGSLIIGCIKDAMLGEKKEYFAGALQIPEGYEFVVAIAAGYKAAGKEPHEYSVEKQVSYL